MNKLTKRLLIIVFILLILAILVIVFISPITKYAIEKYDEQYTGRQIKMDWAYVNPFTGYIHFENLKVYEAKSDSLFMDTKGVSTYVSVAKLWSKKYEFKEIVLDQPVVKVAQDKMIFNFTDLIKRFSPKEKDKTDTVTIANGAAIPAFIIKNGTFYYSETKIPIHYFVKNVNLTTSEKRTNVDTINFTVSLLPGIGSGDISGKGTVNIKNQDYQYAAVVRKFDLQIIGQYLKELTNYGKFRANLDADMYSKGNLKNVQNMTSSGLIAVNDFHLGKTANEDYASFSRLALGIKELSPKRKIYVLDSMTLSHPYLKYEKYDYLDNLQMIFGKKGNKYMAVRADKSRYNLVIEIVKYLNDISRNFYCGYFKIGRLAIDHGNLAFHDYSGSEVFSVGLQPFFIRADSIDKYNRHATVHFRSGIQPYGKATVTLRLNPRDTSNLDIDYEVEQVPATLFNPYLLLRTSFPLDRGTIQIKGNWQVHSGEITSLNHLIVIDPRAAKKVKSESSRWLPVPLILAFVRERGNVIDYEIPMTGNLKNPKFHLRDAIGDLITNILIKPVTIPYRVKVNTTETKIEKLLTLTWAMRTAALTNTQKEFMDKIVDFLKKTPNASISISPHCYAEKERENILFYAAKKKYFVATQQRTDSHLSERDSITVTKMAIKDSNFVRFLNQHTPQNLVFTIQSKCEHYVRTSVVEAQFATLAKERKRVFMDYFKAQGLEKQVRITATKNTVPYNGFSFYRITYKGEFPKDLLEANQALDRLDESSPRSQFAAIRAKSGNFFKRLFQKKK